MIAHDPDHFRLSVATSLYRMAQLRARLHGLHGSVEIDTRSTLERTVNVHPYKVVRKSGVGEMLRVTLAFFVYLGAAVAGLVFASPAVQLVIAGLLVVGGLPLYYTLRRTAESIGIERAARAIRERRERA